MGATTFSYDQNGRPVLRKDPKLLLDDDSAGKPEGIHLVIGRGSYAAFGNSTGDRQILEYTKAGEGERLSMLVLHDDAKREYAYGPAERCRRPRLEFSVSHSTKRRASKGGSSSA